MMQLILASQSPRRSELLRQVGLRFRVQVADIDESPRADESALDLVQRLALEKARAVWMASDQTLPVLGADTLGYLGDTLLVKPCDFNDAATMLRQMSGQAHDILTAVALCSARGEAVRVSHSRVWFRALSEVEIAAYWAEGEPRDKAGAYAIQGLGAAFVARMEGSYSGIVGLPLFETLQMLETVGVSALTGEIPAKLALKHLSEY